MPIISIVLFFLFIFLPFIDPLKKNIEKFRKYYDWFIVVMTGFLFYLYLLTIFWALDYRFNMVQFISPVFAMLFFYIGIMTEHTKRNWFIGIRTPWTLSSEEVWNKTHKLGGRLFKISGVIALLGILFSDYAIFFIIVPVVASAVFAVVYSYVEYRKS